MTKRKKDDTVQSEEQPTVIYSIEAMYELADILRKAQDIQAIDTAHTDGSTTNPHQAQEQGLVYDPPTDPPVLPSDDRQGAEIAAGFASSMEEIDPGVVDLPERVDNQDLDLEQNIRTALKNNSETAHLSDVEVSVQNGVAHLYGSVFSEDDIAIVHYLLRDLRGVREVRSRLQVATD